MAAHLGGSVPLILLLPFAGVVTGIVSVLVGLTALRIRGLYLAVSTLGFALFMQTAVLATSCWTVPLVHKTICSGLPDPQSTLIARPTLFGLDLSSERAFAWFSLAMLIVSVLVVRVWRDRGVARRIISVRDNEVAAGSAGIPVVRTKLMAFALSGFIAGYAGVCFAFATERFSTTTFDPTVSILVISMVVIGGLDAISGAILGALYLVGLPAIFGSTTTTEFLTSGIGLMAFILYLPGGMAQVMHQLGDLATAGIEHLQARRSGAAPPDTRGPGAASTAGVGTSTQPGAVAEVIS
jgi:ABC-type branched-subunit amino acid transport system permease subunit